MKNWTEKEIRFLEDNYHILSPENIALKLNRTIDSIYNKSKRLGIQRTNNNWTEIEIQYVLDNLNILTKRQISKNINKDVSTINRFLLKFFPHLYSSKDILGINKNEN
ncbi:MAG: hypothetical protein WC667_13200 [Sulfurimonas sp.]|jgi:hypothetical protein